MPSKEIKELRQAGKLEEAYAMAKAELEADLDNIWSKRNMSWVIYAQLDAASVDIDAFLDKIEELKQLELPSTEEMLFDNISIVISKAARNISGEPQIDLNKIYNLFDAIKDLPLKRNSKWFSVLYKAFHKGLKESSRYNEFADWWNFENFMPEDFEKDKLPNGREIMALAEQSYIAYAKHLLPKQTQFGETIFDKEKALAFLPILTGIVEKYPQFQYPAYFQAKLLLAVGVKDNMLSALLPFAKKKRNDFWVWEVLAEAFSDDPEKVFVCYCRALMCQSPEEMLVSLRQKMAIILISKRFFNEAKTEIELLISARTAHGFKIPNEVIVWQAQDWYKNATAAVSNIEFYSQYAPIAENLLFSDIPEETVIVEFVNSHKKILNFIASDSKYGFFKYERFISNVQIGDIFKVRFHSGSVGGPYKILTLFKVVDEDFKKQYLKEVEGNVRISEGRPFGFLNDVFIHPTIIIKKKLTNGMQIKGVAMKTYNEKKEVWGWKMYE